GTPPHHRRLAVVDGAPWPSGASLAGAAPMADVLAVTRRSRGHSNLYSGRTARHRLGFPGTDRWNIRVDGCTGCGSVRNHAYLHGYDLRVTSDHPRLASAIRGARLHCV